MHELAIAEAILKQVLSLAEQHQARKVQEVELIVGEMRLVVPESLEIAFAAVAKDTLAEGATLIQQVEKVQVECRQCGRRFSAREQDLRCPNCEQADVRMIEGRDIILKSVILDTEGDT